MRFIRIIAFAMAALVCAFAPAHADKRVALVIGNNSYANLPANEQLACGSPSWCSTPPTTRRSADGSISRGCRLRAMRAESSIPDVTPPPKLADADRAERAERAWDLVRNTTSLKALDEFIAQYGDVPIYGASAKARREEVAKSQVAVVNSG